MTYKNRKIKNISDIQLPDWQRINFEDYTIPKYREYNKDFIKTENKIVKNINDMGNMNMLDFIEKEFADSGVDDNLSQMVEFFNNTGVYIKAEAGNIYENPINIEYKLDEADPLIIDHNFIIAEENSEITIIFDYNKGELLKEENNYFHNGLTKITVKENAVVNIIKIQRFNDSTHSFDSNIAVISNKGQLNWYTVELGSHISVSSYVTNLKKASESRLKSVYFADKDKKFDFEYSMNHQDKYSISDIDARGALKDRAEKVFRGNVDFSSGAENAEGSEQEDVLLLDPEVKADSLPALFSGENNLEGEHAASAGQIEEEKLYYLQSRGFDSKKAEKLVVESKLRPLIEEIPVENLRSEIIEEIKERLKES